MKRIGLLLLLVALVPAAPLSGRDAAPSSDPRPLRGVILFVGDGMGLATITAARALRGEREGAVHPSDGRLRLDSADRVALVRTHSSNRLVTDSAAAITAMMTGHRVDNGVLGVGGEDGETPFETALEIAESRGMATGIVTTTRLTHATPAGAYAHVPRRGEEERIAAALVPSGGNPALGDGIEVVLGGGRSRFSPAGIGTDGRREDGRDLLAELASHGYVVVRDRHGLARAREEGAGRIFGAFASGHLSFEIDRETSAPDEPSLLEMVQTALPLVERDPDGYFLLIEGGRIDHALHDTNGRRAVEEMLAFDEAIGWTLDHVGDDVLVCATSDHDHTMVLAGYGAAGDGIFSVAGTDRDGRPYTTLLFANGPGGGTPERLDRETLADPDFRERAGVPLRSETHGGMDVPLYVWGPRDLLEEIPATLDNTEVFVVLRAGIERGR